MVDTMIEEMTQGADGSDAKCGVIGEIGCSWPLQGKNIIGKKESNKWVDVCLLHDLSIKATASVQEAA